MDPISIVSMNRNIESIEIRSGAGVRLRSAWFTTLICGLLIGTFPYVVAAETPLVQDLVEALKSSDKFDRRNAARIFSEYGSGAEEALPELIAALDDSDTQVWFHSVTAIGRLGPAAASAVPRLIDSLGGNRREENQRWYRSAHALGLIGVPAIPSLFETMRSEKAGERAGAAAAFRWFERVPDEAIEKLADLLTDGKDMVRRQAVEALRQVGAPTISHLLPLLEDGNVAKLAAMDVLAALGDDAAMAVDRIETLALYDPTAEVRAKAVCCLAELDYDANKLVALIEKKFDSDSAVEWEAVADSVLNLPPGLVVGPLIRFLNAPSERSSRRAADLLGRIGPGAESAIPHLISAILDGKELATPNLFSEALTEIGRASIAPLLKLFAAQDAAAIRPSHWAIKSLARIGTPGVTQLKRALHSGESGVRLASLYVLTGIGKTAESALDDVLSSIDDDDPVIRAAAAAALTITRRLDRDSIRVFGSVLADSNSEVRSSALSALIQFGEEASPLRSAVTDRLGDVVDENRRLAAEVLGGMKASAKSSSGRLASLIGRDSDGIVLFAVKALGEIGTEDSGAIAQVSGLVTSANSVLRKAAIECLGRLGAGAAEYNELVRRGLLDSDPKVRESVIDAYMRIEEDVRERVEVIMIGLSDRNAGVRRRAAERVKDVRYDAVESTPVLVEMLSSAEEFDVVLTALFSLPEDPNYLDSYLKALGHDEWSARVYACRVIGRLGRDAKSVLPHLHEASRDRYKPVKDAAERAITAINKDR